MNVLFIKRNLDQAELALVLALRSKGVNIKVLTAATSPGVVKLEQAGVFVESRPYASKVNVRFIRQVRQLVIAERISIVHAVDSRSLANAIWATYFLPVKIVAYRGTLAKIRKTDISYWAGILNPRVDRVICVNTAIYEYLQNFFPVEHLLLDYKGYEPEWSQEVEASDGSFPDLPDGSIAVICVADAKGRPHKGVNLLLEAMHKTARPEIHLIYLGSYDKSSRHLAERGPAASRIHFLGFHRGIAKFLKQADIYVLPSLRDGLPRAVKEAMAEELPVICANIPGPTDLVIDNETGVWFEPGSVVALTEAILALSDDAAKRRRLGRQGKQRLLREFSSAASADKVLDLYRGLVPSKGVVAKPDQRV
ncbi:glycosyltransferase family 4 protein [Marinimicrobium sp. ABcell2]|uniref:glycosyltransferase family 4 protein n=1 Tax=Marinimicrobium sp. ABcell2 TaxID=3069751 RepID=UPI0027B2927D|nr:glycosyltransferase family 4 protein [Marinimicrobium sp. ABcell2]MDQ2077155.1 glycosyltransferase family 4 protein [Marinimicrobium sp. ABcell2]